MKQEYLKFFPYINLTIAAFIIFFAVFVLVFWWAYRRENSEKWIHAANLPLNDEGQKGGCCDGR